MCQLYHIIFPYKEQPDSETSDIMGTNETSGEDDPSDLHVLAPEEIVRNYICKCMQCIRQYNDKFLVLFLE